ncbi:hypothetical protein L484_008811 [Morus notabilis]|uniref:Uncharacterized protein n=1 Tax=Morus notabilis TaxID=981085 RepID=W9QZS7_9ROSA|nr:hypothetical protein L484_008811 [Morus notabilis]
MSPNVMIVSPLASLAPHDMEEIMAVHCEAGWSAGRSRRDHPCQEDENKLLAKLNQGCTMMIGGKSGME